MSYDIEDRSRIYVDLRIIFPLKYPLTYLVRSAEHLRLYTFFPILKIQTSKSRSPPHDPVIALYQARSQSVDERFNWLSYYSSLLDISSPKKP
jgi:hypothetical protein